MLTKIISENNPIHGVFEIQNCNQKYFVGTFEEKTDLWLYCDQGHWRIGFRHSGNENDFTSLSLAEMFKPVSFLSQIPLQARYRLLENRHKMNYEILKFISENKIEGSPEITDLILD